MEQVTQKDFMVFVTKKGFSPPAPLRVQDNAFKSR